MARRHGRNGRIFVAIASGGSAEPVSSQSKWSIDFSTDDDEVTSFGDLNKQYVAGLPDASGSFSGFWDDASAQLYTAAQDGVARKLYLYPDFVNAPGVYWHGTGLFDFSIEVGVGEANKVSGNFKAASSIIKVG